MKVWFFGNGFDLHSRIQSSFLDFSKSIEPQLAEKLSRLLKPNSTWGDFETKMGSFSRNDFEKVFPNATLSEMRGFYYQFRGAFFDWAANLNDSKTYVYQSDVAKMLDEYEQSDVAFTFNYTSLPQWYNPKISLIHIHGDAELLIHGDDEIKVGSAKEAALNNDSLCDNPYFWLKKMLEKDSEIGMLDIEGEAHFLVVILKFMF